MSGLADYLQDVADVLTALSPGGEFVEGPLCKVLSDDIGHFTFRISYPGRSPLDFTATIDFSHGHPDYVTYRLHYEDSRGHCIFRYDNAPHLPTPGAVPSAQAHRSKGARSLSAL